MSQDPGVVGQTSSEPGVTLGRRRGLMVGAVAVSLLAVGGVATVAGQKLFSAGTSQDGQPAAVLPVDSLAYYRVDFDPSTAQKVAAFRLFDKLPEAKKALGDSNPKQALFDLVKKDSSQLKDIDYVNDVEPWLGDRLGVAILAPRDGGKDPMVVAAVQVKDEAKADAGIAKLQEKSGVDLRELTDRAKASASIGADPFGASTNRSDTTSAPRPTPGGETSEDSSSDSSSNSDQDAVHWYRDGYLLFTQKADEPAVRAAIDKGQLTANQDFSKDMADLGEQGVMSGWTDMPKLTAALSTDRQVTASVRGLLDLSGRQAAAVRFDPAYLEVASLTRDNGLNVSHTALRDVGTLPSDTVGFVSATSGADMLKAVWPKIENLAKESNASVQEQLAGLERQTGIKLPGDLETLGGKQLDVVVSEKSVKDKLPVLGLRMLTDPAKAEGVLANLDRLWKQQTLGSAAADSFGLHRKSKGDFVYVGSTRSYLDALVAGGNLADDATLKGAIPNLAEKHGAMFVNLDKIEHLYLENMPNGQQKDLLQALQAVGMSTMKSGDRYDSVIRVTVN